MGSSNAKLAEASGEMQGDSERPAEDEEENQEDGCLCLRNPLTSVCGVATCSGCFSLQLCPVCSAKQIERGVLNCSIDV
jgi:hypothetical protein